MVFRGYLDDKLDLSCCSIDAKDIPAKKDEPAMTEIKRLKEEN